MIFKEITKNENYCDFSQDYPTLQALSEEDEQFKFAKNPPKNLNEYINNNNSSSRLYPS